MAEWDPGEPLVDPMCGSGTFAIEAAGIDMGHAPGEKRAFALEGWPISKAAPLAAMRRRLTDTRRRSSTAILAADRDENAMEATRENAQRAGVVKALQMRTVPFHQLEPIEGPGLVVINPPYGRRVGGGGATRIFRGIGRQLRDAWGGWRVAILVPDRRKIELLELPVEELTCFSNGGIKVHLVVGTVPK
jgi:putative N6-adenine-specific DNA methylase